MTTGVLLTSAMAMNAQSHAMGQIGTNIANVNTAGYKKQETMFATLLSYETNNRNSIFSSGVTDRKYVVNEGMKKATGRRDDLAITGRGFFILNGNSANPTDDGSMYYSRAGDFTSKRMENESYLVNNAGLNVLGWNYNNESASFSSGLEPLRTTVLDEIAGFQTTTAKVKGNIKALGGDVTGSEKLSFTVYDSEFNPHVMVLKFASREANNWDFSVEVDGNPAAPSVTNVEFNQDATIKTPSEAFSVAVDYGNGLSGNVSLDLSLLEQYSSDTENYGVISDGAAKGYLSDTYWDKDGILQATYSNARTVPVCKVALADFTSPNLLEASSGTMFRRTSAAGDMVLMDLEDKTFDYSNLSGESLENSNVDLEDSFTKMITTQKAYSSASTTFKTGDEMYQEAINLKN